MSDASVATEKDPGAATFQNRRFSVTPHLLNGLD
ncbi:hypothetical protein P3T21_006612 [Paraburkholderia sp. GAS334]